MHHLLSTRIKTISESATLGMNKKIQSLRAAGHVIADLSLGEPDMPTPYYIQEAAKKAIDSGAYFGYPPVAGYKELREAITAKMIKENNILCTPEQVVVSTGAKLSLANLFLCLLNPGDEVIVFTPYWVSYPAIIELAGGKPIYVKGKKDNNFEPTLEQIEQAITPNTKAIIFSSPSNPHGHILSNSYLLQLASLLQNHKNILVIADEIYEYINFTTGFTSLGSLPGMQDQVVTVNGFSKSFAMTGWRIGYLVAPVWLAKACEKVQGQLTAGTCSIAQRAALAAFEVDSRIIQGMLCDTYKRRRDIAIQHILALKGVTCNLPQGAFYLFPDISYYFGYTDGKTILQNAEDFCMYLLEEARVALVSGTSFGGSNCVRLSYTAADETLEEALQRIQQALERLKPAHIAIR